MEAMDATWLQLWRRLYCSPLTWPSWVSSSSVGRGLLNLKRYVGMVCTHPLFIYLFLTSLWLFVRLLTLLFQAVQVAFRVEEITNSDYHQLDDERNRRLATVESFNIADQSNKDLRKNLKEKEQARRAQTWLWKALRSKLRIKGYFCVTL